MTSQPLTMNSTYPYCFKAGGDFIGILTDLITDSVVIDADPKLVATDGCTIPIQTAKGQFAYCLGDLLM